MANKSFAELMQEFCRLEYLKIFSSKFQLCFNHAMIRERLCVVGGCVENPIKLQH